ncbi:efflux RND transporter periplasmic adaptor subunit [Chitinophaga barathri]|uniref:Efflux RND transporter periplasmic adaptor subunit n=1 Tax=Chitinophaga barathri TaxID=1647451 RepID=A0A3N4N5V8_9BACT|nr:efflux RND transporter periplasmic adaptor subunit [Chitinophaga barathri]RPD43023.1 efflux RND transporter periplasmic adaptor subunit [Chitinophaga barathri]
MTINNMRHIWSIITIILLAACGGEKKPAGQSKPAQDTVLVFLLKTETARKTVELPAELKPFEQADLYSKVQGFVKTVNVEMGDHIRKGQTLAVIEAPEVNSRLAESEAAIQSEKAKWNSSKDHYERLYRASQAKTPGIVAPADLERQRQQMLADSATFLAAAKQAQSYKAVSGYLHITAPFDGIVTARLADPGAMTGPGTVLFTVQNNSTLRLRAAVPEIYVSTMPDIREISFRVDAYPTRQFAAKLMRKSGAIDPATRTELWEFIADNRDQSLKAGAFAYVKLGMSREGLSLIVPPTAIVTTQERKFIIRVKYGKAQWVDVRQGMTTDKGIEIFGDIQPGDTILVKGTDERKPETTAVWKIKS